MYAISADVERTQQRKLEELFLAAAREGRTAELIGLVKTTTCLLLYNSRNFLLKIIS